MAKQENGNNDLPKNKAGGLNLNWAIQQALAKLGEDASISDVREFIVVNYKNLGRKAVENTGSLSTGISSMRKKMREEAKKVPPVPVAASRESPPVPVATNGNTPPAPPVTPRPDSPPDLPTTSATFRDYVTNVLQPSLAAVEGGVATAGSFENLKRAVKEVDDAQTSLGVDLNQLVKLFLPG